MSRSTSKTIYVGNLPGDIRKSEVEDIFYKYGKIVDIDLKLPPRPPAYAFVEFETIADAEDAIRGRDGYEFDGERLRVELAHSGASRDRGDGRGGRGDGRERFGPSRRSEFRVLVTGLPPSASWQDLKDHMRKAGTVTFAQVFRDGTGICDYDSLDDMRYAVRKLDDTEFKNPFSSAYIRVKEDRGGGRRSRSVSRSPRRKSRSRSRSRSQSQSRSRSRSAPRSPVKARSASPVSD